jgi:AcrR family transcriptional regulator
MRIPIKDMSGRERYNRERQETAWKRKQVVIDRAEELFLNKGLNQVTMSDIMEAAGISKATLYRYFNNMDEIIFEVQYRKMSVLFHNAEPLASPLKFVLGMIDNFNQNRDAFRFIGMFDNHYSEKYPNEEMAREYEVFTLRNDRKSVSLSDESTREMHERFVIVINVVISFLQRLALRGDILEKYQGITVERQLEELKHMVKREFAF